MSNSQSNREFGDDFRQRIDVRRFDGGRSDRRVFRRKAGLRPALIVADFGTRAGFIEDVSESGIKVGGIDAEAIRSCNQCRFDLPRKLNKPARIESSCEVAWADPSGKAGLRLVGMPAEARRTLQEWIDSDETTANAREADGNLSGLKFEPSRAASLHSAAPLSAPGSGEPDGGFQDFGSLINAMAAREIGPLEILRPPLKKIAENIEERSQDSSAVNPVEEIALLRNEIKQRKLPLDEALHLVAERVAEFTHADGAAVCLRDDGDDVNTMRCRATRGSARQSGERFHTFSGLLDECVGTGRIVRCDDTFADTREDVAVWRQNKIRSVILVPLHGEKNTIGLLEVLSARPHAFDYFHVLIFRVVAEMVVALVREKSPGLGVTPVRDFDHHPVKEIAPPQNVDRSPERDTPVISYKTLQEYLQNSQLLATTSPRDGAASHTGVDYLQKLQSNMKLVLAAAFAVLLMLGWEIYRIHSTLPPEGHRQANSASPVYSPPPNTGSEKPGAQAAAETLASEKSGQESAPETATQAEKIPPDGNLLPLEDTPAFLSAAGPVTGQSSPPDAPAPSGPLTGTSAGAGQMRARMSPDPGELNSDSALGRAPNVDSMDVRERTEKVSGDSFTTYRIAAEHGDAASQNLVGDMYRRGRGAPKNFKEAVKWYQLAAAQGLDLAQTNLADMYRDGKGIRRDLSMATRYYRAAADKSYAPAQVDLGDLYREGKGVPKDLGLAAQWYRRAATQGSVIAQTNLGDMYRDGLEVP